MKTKLFAFLDDRIENHLGSAAAKAFAALKIESVGDLMRHVPRRYMDGTECTDLADLQVGDHVAVLARVVSTKHFDVSKREVPLEQDLIPANDSYYKVRDRLEATISDGSGELRLTFFGRPGLVSFWRRNLHRGTRGIFAGKVGQFRDQLQITHPQFVMLDDSGVIVGHSDEKKQNLVTIAQSDLISIYPASAKLPTWTIASCAQQIASVLPEDEPLPLDILAEAGVLPLVEAFRAIHLPTTRELAAAGAERLVFDEAFGAQLTMAYRRNSASRRVSIPRPPKANGLAAALRRQLPFTLTEGQVEIAADLALELNRDRPMNRLLQGEVGSGKTLVALLAMLQVVDAGGQAVLFAPTEVLASQHYETITGLLGDLVNRPQSSAVLLTGSMTAIAKKNVLLKIASGAAGIVIGTHALLADRVKFADLGLVVVDEQHRFGVGQRTTLVGKGESRPHVLVMTATPIPRSVAMTMFGDLDVSTLTQLPSGRSPIPTTVVDTVAKPAWVLRVWTRMREEVAAGRQVFVVAPRIDSDGEAEPSGAVAWAEWLRSGPAAGLKVGLLHGSLPPASQREVMAAFSAGDLDILVATTIVEVGVDVPNATMMIITQAELFGVSQLHQLRGRVGRGSAPGLCLLLTSAEEGSAARSRLDAVAGTMDGFRLADIDLEQRCEGDVLGGGQSGKRSSLRLLRVLQHQDVIRQAFDLAQKCVATDPDCEHPGLADYVEATEALASGDWGEAG